MDRRAAHIDAGLGQDCLGTPATQPPGPINEVDGGQLLDLLLQKLDVAELAPEQGALMHVDRPLQGQLQLGALAPASWCWPPAPGDLVTLSLALAGTRPQVQLSPRVHHCQPEAYAYDCVEEPVHSSDPPSTFGDPESEVQGPANADSSE
jgi:hypothetical protein